ncbi:MAG TPA: tetratricopeptide repeat protein [Bacteriovoracaceae bacterium]|nr:tetratricopeptide repeat protein [Bacteriovoracaceae bacterium]
MKTLTPILILFLLASCATQRLDRKIDDAGWDSLADESYLRWGEKRLQSTKTEHEVTKCYQGKARETLVQYKKDYLTKGQQTYYWLHIGNCYFVQNLWSKAEFFYRLSLDEAKAPEVKSIALNNLGLLHFKYEQWEKGKEYLKQAIALAPNYKIPRYNISQLYLQFGIYDKAIEVLNAGAFSGHKDIDVYFSLANAYLYKGDLKNAAQYFKLIPPEQFKREDIAATYALYLIRTGKMKQAKKVMDERDRSGVLEITAISQKIEKILSQRMKAE